MDSTVNYSKEAQPLLPYIYGTFFSVARRRNGSSSNGAFPCVVAMFVCACMDFLCVGKNDADPLYYFFINEHVIKSGASEKR